MLAAIAADIWGRHLIGGSVCFCAPFSETLMGEVVSLCGYGKSPLTLPCEPNLKGGGEILCFTLDGRHRHRPAL